jgi:hypothetical protein
VRNGVNGCCKQGENGQCASEEPGQFTHSAIIEIDAQGAEYSGIYSEGVIRLAAAVGWPDGTPVTVRVAEVPHVAGAHVFGKVIIAGFGLAGRWIADIFERHHLDYVIVEQNAETCDTQRRLNRNVLQGSIEDEGTMLAAGIKEASILALTVPDEQAVLKATRLARRLKPDIYIVARTLYSSSGLQASHLGADEVIKAEQVVARQFYEMLLLKIGLEQAAEPAGQH